MVSQKDLLDAVRFIKSKTTFRPKVAVILGSGLGDFADSVEVASVISSSDIPNYPTSTVQGHAGKVFFGHLSQDGIRSAPLLVFKGRVHFYESGSLDSALFPLALAHKLGTRTLLVTNAAGGINRQFTSGDLMLIRDIVNLTFQRFPFLSSKRFYRRNYFDDKLQSIIRDCSVEMKIRLQEGTYCWLKGPTYETASEIRMLDKLGVDAVGMSTVPEIVLAHALKMRAAGISLISNLATGISNTKLSHEEVSETADKVKEKFAALMKSVLLKI